VMLEAFMGAPFLESTGLSPVIMYLTSAFYP
jgi:hypothetical protein